MLRTSTLVALAAAITFGATMLTPTTASAYGGYKGYKLKHFHPGYQHHHWRWRWRPRPVFVVAPRPVVYGAAPVMARPAAPGPCTCLSKEYTQEGAVMFKDRCTNEMAMNPPPAPPQATTQYAPQPEATPQQMQPQVR